MLVLELEDGGAEMILASLMESAGIGGTGGASEFFLFSDMQESLKPVLGNELKIELGRIVFQNGIVIGAGDNSGFDILTAV